MRLTTLEEAQLLNTRGRQKAPNQRHACTPLEPAELVRINGFAEFVLNALREQVGTSAGYDEKSLSVISKNISRKRLTYDSATAEKIATLYGAFLARVLIEGFPAAAPTLVRAENNIGVAFTNESGEQRLVFPIARVFQHIELGEEHSLHLCFTALSLVLAAPSISKAVEVPVPVPVVTAEPVKQPVAAEVVPVAEPETEPPSDSSGFETLNLASFPIEAGVELGLDDSGTPLEIHVPEMCCNCGSHVYPMPKDSTLAYKHVVHATVKFGYCGRCAHTAGKLPMNPIARAGIVTLASALLGFVAYQIGAMPLWAVSIAAVVGVASTIWIRSPGADVTSTYQPVRLAGWHLGARGIKQVVLYFTNKKYAEEFSLLNAKLVSAGVVKIELENYFHFLGKRIYLPSRH